MRNMKVKVGILLVAALVATLGVYIYYQGTGMGTAPLAEGKQELSLTPPTFLSSIGTIATTLDEEAGMSIWLNATADSPLNLDVAKNKMINNLENVTSDYVIGSIPLADFSSDDYPHCFVHKDGWIIVYYLRINTQNPSTTGWLGKMIILSDSNYYTKGVLKNNLLQKGMETIYSGLVQTTPMTNAKYYHFQYPNAAKLMIAIKEAGDSQTVTFNVQVPGSFTIDEYSWAFYTNRGAGGWWNIDATQICSGSGRHYGGPEIIPAVLSPDVWHTVTLHANYYYNENLARVCILILYH